MVRPYLNKSDHEEFLEQYRHTRNLKIRKYLLISTFALAVLGTGAYILWGNNTVNSSENFPAYLGGENESPTQEKELSPALAETQETLDASENSEIQLPENNTPEKKANSQTSIKPPKTIPASDLIASAETKTVNKGRTRGNDSGQAGSSQKTSKSESNSPIIRVSDTKELVDTPELPQSGMKRNPELDKVVETPLFSAEKMPKFPGGYSALKRYIKTRLNIPKEARKNNIDGTVQVQFIVGSAGTISNPRISKGLGYGCDEAALALVKSMPKWIPGKQDGQTVAVYYNLPIDFSVKK